MEIEIGKLYKNKTFNFLVPIFTDYPVSFKQKMEQQVFKLAYGIHDRVLDNTEIIGADKRPIFILCDKLAGNFDNYIDWLKSQDYYITDYVAGTNINSRYHMVVIDTIKPYHKAYDKFCLGLYSEMYDEDQLKRLFTNKKNLNSEAISILTKDTFAQNKFIKKINNIFGEQIQSVDEFYEPLKECELSYKITADEEIFNYNLE